MIRDRSPHDVVQGCWGSGPGQGPISITGPAKLGQLLTPAGPDAPPGASGGGLIADLGPSLSSCLWLALLPVETINPFPPFKWCCEDPCLSPAGRGVRQRPTAPRHPLRGGQDTVPAPSFWPCSG